MNSPQFCHSKRRGRPVQQGLRRHNPSQVELQPLSQRGTRVFIGSHVSTSHIRLTANDVWRSWGRGLGGVESGTVSKAHTTTTTTTTRSTRNTPSSKTEHIPHSGYPSAPQPNSRRVLWGSLSTRLWWGPPPRWWTSPESVAEKSDKWWRESRDALSVIWIVTWQTGRSVWYLEASRDVHLLDELALLR